MSKPIPRPASRALVAFLSFVLVFFAGLTPAVAANSGVCGSTLGPGVDVALVLDRSGSMKLGVEIPKPNQVPSRINAVKQVASAQVQRMTEVDQTALISFATGATVDQGLTSDTAAVVSAINGMVAAGVTDMGAGIGEGSNELLANGRVNAKKVMVLLSDGAPTDDPFPAANAAKAAGIEIYTIAFGINNAHGNGIANLRAIASDESHFHDVHTVADLAFTFDSIFSEILEHELDLLANSYAVKGTGVFAILNNLPIENRQTWQFDDGADPQVVQAGGSSTVIPNPLPGLGNNSKVSADTVTNSATGTVDTVSLTGTANAAGEIEGLVVRLAGVRVVTASVVNYSAVATRDPGGYSAAPSLTTANVRVAGVGVLANIAPNSHVTVSVPGLVGVNLVLNEQASGATADSTFASVNFLHLTVTGLGPLAGELIVGHAFAGASCEEGAPPFPAAEF